MDLSLFLCRFFGIYFVIMALLYPFRRKEIQAIVDDFAGNKALIYTVSLYNVIIGLLLTLSHQVWELDWQGGITAIGFLILLKGLIGLFFPSFLIKLSRHSVKNAIYPVFILIFGVIGLYFLYEGFFRQLS